MERLGKGPEQGRGFPELGAETVQGISGESEEVLSLEETLEAYNYQLQDPTYVPDIEEFEAMETLAEEHIEVVLPSAKTPIKYIGKDSDGNRKLNPHLARTFLDGVSANRWRLSDDEIAYLGVARQESAGTRAVIKSIGMFGLQEMYNIQPAERKHQVLTWGEYTDNFPDSWMTEHSILANGYKEYTQRKLDLGLWIRQREK